MNASHGGPISRKKHCAYLGTNLHQVCLMNARDNLACTHVPCANQWPLEKKNVKTRQPAAGGLALAKRWLFRRPEGISQGDQISPMPYLLANGPPPNEFRRMRDVFTPVTKPPRQMRWRLVALRLTSAQPDWCVLVNRVFDFVIDGCPPHNYAQCEEACPR